MKNILLIFALVAVSHFALAQQINTTTKVVLQLKTPQEQTYHEYTLNSIDYYYTKDMNMTNDSTRQAPFNISLSWTSQADNYLLQWISGQKTDMQGKVLVREIENNKILRQISFEGAQIYTYNESFNTGASYGIYPVMSIIVKKMTINGIEF